MEFDRDLYFSRRGKSSDELRGIRARGGTPSLSKNAGLTSGWVEKLGGQ